MQANADSASVIDSGNTAPLCVRPATSLYSVERIFAQLRAPSMLEALACALLAGPAVPIPRPLGPLAEVTTNAAAAAAAAVAAEAASEAGPIAAGDSGSAAAAAAPGDDAGDGSSNPLLADGASGKTADTGSIGPVRRSKDRESWDAADARSRRLASSGSIGSTRSLASASGMRLARCRDAVLACLRSSDAPSAAAAVRALAAAAAARLPTELAAALGLALDPTGDVAAAGAVPLTSYPGSTPKRLTPVIHIAACNILHW